MEKMRVFVVALLSWFLLSYYLGYLPHLQQKPQSFSDHLLELFSKYVPFFKKPQSFSDYLLERFFNLVPFLKKPQSFSDNLLELFSKYVPFFKKPQSFSNYLWERFFNLVPFLKKPQSFSDYLLERFYNLVPFLKPRKTHWITKPYQGLTASWNKYFDHAATQQRQMEMMMNFHFIIAIVMCISLITQIMNYCFSERHCNKCYCRKKSRSTGTWDHGSGGSCADHESGTASQITDTSSQESVTDPSSKNQSDTPALKNRLQTPALKNRTAKMLSGDVLRKGMLGGFRSY